MTVAPRGMALPLALFALVMISALVAGAFAGARLEQRIGRNMLYAVQAKAAGEAGAAAVVHEWEGHGLAALVPGQGAVLPAVALARGTTYAPTVTRLNGELFLVQVAGVRSDADGGELARREVGLLVRVADSVLPGQLPVRLLAYRSWTGHF
jgi:hypothetical protein